MMTVTRIASRTRQAALRALVLLAAFCLLPLSAHARPAPDSFAPLVEKLMPAVVNISTTQEIQTQPMLPNMPEGQMDQQLQDFLERMLPPEFRGFGGTPVPREAQSLGSGFIIDKSGYIVTNTHVIANATEITVNLQDDTQLPAEIVGRDSKTDIALLKVESDDDLPFVSLGNSDDARVGDWVIAIGNPFGLGGTVTAGIISARARRINAGPFDDFIQTDASINRGNSGGPLFNIDGEVIGINTAIFSPSGGSIGIGFAVPTALAGTVIEQLKEHGRTYRGWLGVKIQTVTEEIAESLNMRSPKGALVAEVSDNSPAKKSGLEIGDVILSFDGKPIEEMYQLPRIVAETEIGKEVDVEILRNGKKRNVEVTLGELDEGITETADASQPGSKNGAPKDVTTHISHGMTLVKVDKAARERYGLADDASGLLVVEVDRMGEAARQGILRGDVIVQVNDRKMESMDDFKDAIDAAADDGRNNALLRVSRDGSVLFITLPTGEKK